MTKEGKEVGKCGAEETVLTKVIAAVRVALRDPAVYIEATTHLQDIHGFDSLFVATLIEEAEQSVGTELLAEFIVPETFLTPRTLASAFLDSEASQWKGTAGQ